MASKGHFTRIDIGDLRSLIYQKIGHERAQLYFNLLNRLFNSKISKSEFDKLCIRTVGREHLSLHNRFIHSILKNASLSKIPPPKTIKPSNPLNNKIINNYPKKRRTPVGRDLKFRDRPSPLGPLGKTRSPTVDQSPTEPNSLGSRAEDGEEVEQVCVNNKTPIMAPLGISFLNFRNKSLLKDLPDKVTCQSSYELPDTLSLRGRLEQRLSSCGVGISADCVNLLNNGLDIYLKRLIESGMGLARSRNRSRVCMSMLDLRVSIESNPRILGEDWPIQLEKICSSSYQE